jgi:nucleotide-binding universal stress UspA family protein
MKTIMCAVDESDGASEAVAVARLLSKELGMRLVLAHVVDGGGGAGRGGVPALQEAQQLLERVACRNSLESSADRRAEVGNRAGELSRIAREEAAVVILIGSRNRYRRRLSQMSRLSAELTGTAPCPVVIVPSRSRR